MLRSVHGYLFGMSILLSTLLPLFAHAEGTVVVFLSGLCNAQVGQDACRASQQAYDALKTKLPAGTRLHIPQLTNNAVFPDQGSLNNTLSQLRSDRVVFIAYSGGNKALWEIVSKLDTAGLQRVKSLVSLEAVYSGWHNSVNKVKSVNPNVEVRLVTSSQFNTNHGRLPGNEGVANAIVGLVGGDPNALPVTNTAYDPNRPQANQITLGPAPYTPPITSSMPVSSQAPLTSAFTPTAAPSPYTQNINSVNQALVIPISQPTLPPPIMTDSLFSTTSITAPRTTSSIVPVSTTVLTPPPAPSTFTSGPMTSWSAPLAVFDVRQEMARALSNLENFLKGLLQRF